MSLLKQLLISVSLAILIILAGTLWLTVNSARSYLNTQLQSQTDSAATSLALTLSQSANQDPITQELIIMAQFDSGQFNRITLNDPDGAILFNRQTDEKYYNEAPQWFAQLFPVIVAESRGQVSDGWRQVGELYLQADASYAQDSLWHSFIRLAIWVLAAGVVWALFVLFLIRWLRRVLHEDVAEQLNALTNPNIDTERSNHSLKSRSSFSELDEVTQAIAHARQSILATAEEQHTKIESLEIELNQDPVTGLANRKYFINELRHQLENKRAQAGWLFLFRQRDLAKINRFMARAKVDEWLRNLSDQLQLHLKTYQAQNQNIESLNLARLNGSDFVVLGTGLTEAQMTQVAREVQLILRQQRIHLPTGDFCRWAMAQTDIHAGQELVHILSRLDQALMRAESAGHNAVEILTAKQMENQIDQPRGGETEWRALIQQALEQKGFGLEFQSISYINDVPCYQTTLLLHLKENKGDALTGYQFMPVATRVGLSSACDLRALELAIDWLQSQTQQGLIIRISLASITEALFIEKVAACFRGVSQTVAHRLFIELDAYAIASEPVAVSAFGYLLQQHQVKLGMRRALSMPRVLLDLTSKHVGYIRVTDEELNTLVKKEGGVIMLRCALEICQITQVDFVISGKKPSLIPEVTEMLHEYGIKTEK